jgi:hypothetical protein
MVRLIVALIFLTSTGTVQPPDRGNFRLRDLSANTYLAALPSIIQSVDSYSEPLWQYAEAITTEWQLHHQNSVVEPEIILAAFSAMYHRNSYLYERDVMGRSVMKAMVDAQLINFDPDSTTTLNYQPFTFTISPRDFDGDNQPEWIINAEASNYSQLFVVQRRNNEYRLIPTPLPWFGCCFAYYSDREGFIEEQRFMDLTGDGNPEWVLAVGGQVGNYLSRGHLIILQWLDDTLVNIAPEFDGFEHLSQELFYDAPSGAGRFLFPYGVEVSYEDVNDDGITEVIIDQRQTDNWGCSWTYHRVFSWNDSQYFLNSDERIYDDVQGCEFRAAEEAMWSRDLETAIHHYERGLTLTPTEEYWNGNPEQLVRYATIRLALAYRLAGQGESASAIIGDLAISSEDSSLLNDLAAAVDSNAGNDIAMCLAARNVFDFDCTVGTDMCLGSPLNTIVGYTMEHFGEDIHHPSLSYPSPTSAGCDIRIPLAAQVESATLSADRTPTDLLEEMGFEIVRSLHIDLNMDGQDEWFVWLNLPGPALFFTVNPGESTYRFQYAAYPRPFGDSPWDDTASDPASFADFPSVVRMLPDGTTTLITALRRFHNGRSPSCPPEISPDGGESYTSIRAVLDFWQFDGEGLMLTQEIPFCEEIDFDSLLGSEMERLPTEIAAWAPVPDSPYSVVPATYQWNSATGAYEINTLQLPETEDDVDLSSALAAGDFERALEMIETGLAGTDIEDNELARLHYLRAVILESLGNSSEALADYINIYETGPNSTWGRLAALHLETGMT